MVGSGGPKTMAFARAASLCLISKRDARGGIRKVTRRKRPVRCVGIASRELSGCISPFRPLPVAT